MPNFWGAVILAPSSKLAAGLALLAWPLLAQNLETLAQAYSDKPTAANRTALLSFARAHPKDSSGALALLAVGAQDALEKRSSDAIAHLKGAASRLPSLADYFAYLTAVASFDSGDDAGVAKALSGMWKGSPKSPLMARSALLAARSYTRAGQPRQAVELLKNLYDDLAQPETDLAIATTFEASKDPLSAANYYQRVYYSFPRSAEADQAEAAITRLRAALGASYPPAMPQAMLGRALKITESGNQRQARKELEALIPLLGGAERELARVRIGVTYYNAKENSEAFQYLKGLDLTAPEADAERLYYELAAARRLKNLDDVHQSLDKLARLYPQSKWRLEALVASGNHYLLENQVDAYEPLYRACYESFPSSTQAAYCHWKVTFAQYVRRKPEAGQMLQMHLRNYPDSEQAATALYFLGRLAESASRFGEARAYYQEIESAYPNYYYAVLAREKLKTPAVAKAAPATAVMDFLKGVKFPPRSRRVSFESDAASKARIERSQLLARAGLDEYAEMELRFGARADGQSHVLAVELARSAMRRDAPDQAIRYIKRYAPAYLYMPIDSAPVEFWKLAFPLPFREPLERYSRENSLDPYLIAALIRQESEFNPKAISRARAYGLTQVLPSTGRELSRRLKLRPYNTSMLFRPDVNLRLGTYYLKALYTQLNQRWEVTLAAYNAGKSRALAWLNWAEFREPAEFIEAIPFTETRNYIQIVVRNADVYRRLYGGGTAH